MSTPAEDWTAIAASMRTELRNETSRRAALTAAGKPPPTTYSFAGRSFSWNEYLRMMAEAIMVAEDRAAAQEPYELHTTAYSG